MSTDSLNKARSIFYIIIISGLLSLTSFVIQLVWNNSISTYVEMEEISFLEAVGIVAFVYVIYFGIQFGSAKCKSDSKEDNMTEQNAKPVKMSYADELIAKDLLKNVPSAEREDLKDFIARCCGFQDLPSIDKGSVQHTIRPEEKQF